MTAKQFKENIWWQLGFLLVIAVVCGALLGGVWFISQKYSKNTSNPNIYQTIYGENFVYTKVENFETKQQTTSRGGAVVATEKVYATTEALEEGANIEELAVAKIIKIVGTYSSWVNLEMYVVVEDDAAKFIYFSKQGATYMHAYQSLINNNILQVSDFISVSAPTTVYTQDVIASAIKLAEEV